LISGTVFWIILFIAAFKNSEQKRIQKIDKTDISDWENNRIQNE